MNKTLPILLAIVVISGLGAANVMASARFTDSGQELKKLEQEKISLEKDNIVLQQFILEQTSLTNINEIAESKGFVKPDQLITIEHSQQPVALSR